MAEKWSGPWPWSDPGPQSSLVSLAVLSHFRWLKSKLPPLRTLNTVAFSPTSWMHSSWSSKYTSTSSSRQRRPLIVLKTHQLDMLRAFYSALCISFTEEKHGDGPLHLAARVGDVVLELYPLAADAGPADAMTRLGFAVPDLDAVLARLGAAVVSGPRETELGRRAVVRDPDGRKVEMVQG
jgi:lactoylglutathione lyase